MSICILSWVLKIQKAKFFALAKKKLERGGTEPTRAAAVHHGVR